MRDGKIVYTDLYTLITLFTDLLKLYERGHLFSRLFYIPSYLFQCFELMAVAVGLTAWHSVAWWFGSENRSLLSERCAERRIVYKSLGHLLLSLLFINYECTVAWAYPVLVGCIYGTLNNIITVHNCPEYYTLGHVYCEYPFRRHVICTNNLLIKPLITGCYGSQALTKYIGLTLLVLKRCRLQTPTIMETFIAMCITFVISQCAAMMTLWRIESMYTRYEDISGFRLDNTSFKDDPFVDVHHKGCLHELDQLASRIEDYIPDENMPIRLIKPWSSNASRNGCSYLCGLIGFVLLLVLY